MSTRRILVGYDRSADARAAARWALDEASRTGAPVEFFYAYEWPVWAPAASMVPATSVWPDSQTVQEIETALREAVTAAGHSHPEVHATSATTDNDAALALIGRSADARLIVLGSRGHSAVANLLGSLSAAVSAHAHCPVVVVRGEPDPAAPVVVGFDGSACAEDALDFAAHQADERGVPLRVIRAGAPADDDHLIELWRGKLPGLQISAETVAGHPAAVLTAAGATAQLLVVGSRGRGAVRAMLIGSVSQHLLRNAACTVAVVHRTGSDER